MKQKYTLFFCLMNLFCGLLTSSASRVKGWQCCAPLNKFTYLASLSILSWWVMEEAFLRNCCLLFLCWYSCCTVCQYVLEGSQHKNWVTPVIFYPMLTLPTSHITLGYMQHCLSLTKIRLIFSSAVTRILNMMHNVVQRDILLDLSWKIPLGRSWTQVVFCITGVDSYDPVHR